MGVGAIVDFPERLSKRILLVLLGVAFIGVGITHFTDPTFFVRIMPPQIPAHLAMVYISGVAEIAGGLGILIGRVRRLAGYGLLALLVAVYPANIHMALSPEPFVADGIPVWVLYARLPFQFVFMALVWWSALHREKSGEGSARGAVVSSGSND